MKLFTLLAKTDHLSGTFKNLISDYTKFFKTKQSAFKGFKKTYDPKEGTVDIPALRGYQGVVTTVPEKLNYFEDVSKEYLQALFNSERTNASGKAVAELKVDGESWGIFSSLELLRLKSVLSNASLKAMYLELPVREETKNWTKSSNEEFSERNIYEDAMIISAQHTSTKESYILPDPNINKVEGAKYTPQVAVKDIKVELGVATMQSYSGEVTHAYRAGILQRIDKLLVLVLEALKEANDCEVVESNLNVDKLFAYLHKK